ncbi:DNA topoisomerase I [Williamsoniiplasma luminosum]|uniref:DNA topoisomerase n=1 Tax=Williamsoniiplasma luminosum TaxID=214888 RepID=A0A2K8NWT4_9MOLU|nr:DNA topoisomerase [Williamsoniiplasma luminosum]ATZ17201.1 DNA topoisomerase I [Williamsoniiplasma luminosum]
MKYLIIMESPSKAKHVVEYAKELQPQHKWIGGASIGHIRELSNSFDYSIGVDWNKLEASWIVSADKKKVVEELKTKASEVDQIILASDPDREGEAIAWHLFEILKNLNKPFKRMKLNSITKDEVARQLNNLSEIDYNLVNSANTRTILDKTIGYVLSQEVRQNTGGASTGRVQGATLRLIATNQQAIEEFVKDLNYTIKIEDINQLVFNLITEELKDWKTPNKPEMEQILNSLISNKANVISFVEKEFKENFFQPFDTQSALVAIIGKLKGGTSKATKALQILYEAGLITYIRTDSRNIDIKTKEKLSEYIINKFGQKALGVLKDVKVDSSAQEGHPAIIPTDFSLAKVQDKINDEYVSGVYEIIYKNTISYGLKEASGLNQTLVVELNNFIFRATAKNYLDYGVYDLYFFDKKPESNNIKPKTNFIDIHKKELVEIESKPKTLFTEVSLIKEMKKNGLGRPATYANAVEVNQRRGYTEIKSKSKISILPLGKNVNDYLKNNWNDIIAVNYTIQLEKELDLISSGKMDHKIVLKDFWNKLMKEVSSKTIQYKDCKKCKQKTWKEGLISKKGFEYSKCINETCDHIEFVQETNRDSKICTNCKVGFLKLNKTKTGKDYEYCSNKECEYINWDYGLKKCKKCKVGVVFEGVAKNGNKYQKCKNQQCDFIKFFDKKSSKSMKDNSMKEFVKTLDCETLAKMIKEDDKRRGFK